MNSLKLLVPEKKFAHELAKLYMSGLDTSHMTVEDFYEEFKTARQKLLNLAKQESSQLEWQ